MLCNTVEKLIPLGETEVFGTVRPMCGDAVTFTVFSGVSTDQDTGFSKVFYCGSATFGGTDIVDFLLLRDNSSRMCGYFVRVCASGQVSVGRAFQGSGDPLQQIPRAVAVRIGPDAKGFFESTFIKRWGCGGKQVTGFRNSKPDYLTPWACGVDRRNEHLGYRVAGPGLVISSKTNWIRCWRSRCIHEKRVSQFSRARCQVWVSAIQSFWVPRFAIILPPMFVVLVGGCTAFGSGVGALGRACT